MTALETWYASGGKKSLVVIVEINRASADPFYLYAGFEDITVTLESGEEVVAQPSPIEAALLKKDNSGNQSLVLGFSNVTGEVLDYINDAFADDETVYITYREYLTDDLSKPAKPSVIMTAHGVDVQESTVKVQAGYFDVINTGFNREIYTADHFPGLRYQV